VAEQVVHWDDIEPFRADEGAFQSTWTDLGRAAGSVTVGVKRVQVEPGARSTPLHMEGNEEEIFFVLDGSGLSWQDEGDGETTYEIRGGDCLIHLAGAEAHSVVAGPEGIDYLAFGTRATAEYAFFPRLKAGRIGMLWADMIATHQWTQELALGDPELPEPTSTSSRRRTGAVATCSSTTATSVSLPARCSPGSTTTGSSRACSALRRTAIPSKRRSS
jgi:uncharacterized cupin superfamily protein